MTPEDGGNPTFALRTTTPDSLPSDPLASPMQRLIAERRIERRIAKQFGVPLNVRLGEYSDHPHATAYADALREAGARSMALLRSDWLALSATPQPNAPAASQPQQ